MPMSLRQLGSTDLLISPIGLGLAALGRPGYVNLGHGEDLNGATSVSAMETNAHHVMDMAWANGVRYFDAARSYGMAEQFLGEWLRARHIVPGRVTVSSKWGYTYTADWQVQAEIHEIKEHTLPVLQRQWNESLSSLGKYLGLYQIHSATLESGVLDNSAVLNELAHLKKQQVFIGLTLSGSQQAKTLQHALTIKLDGVYLFDCVQATWNLLETSAASVLQEARAAGWGIIIKEALANGRLTARNTDPEFAEKRIILERHALRLETTLDALMLAAVLAQPWVHGVLSGATTTAQLESNLKAIDVIWDEEVATDLATIAEDPAVYWAIRRTLAWN